MAVFFQTFRNAIQSKLSSTVPTAGVTLSRFLFAPPIAAAYVCIVSIEEGIGVPEFTPRFWLFIVLGALLQIAATSLMVVLFKQKNFADMVGALREFAGLPHRCEIVGDFRGVRWINDSKGTNVGATVAALEGMGRPVVLIAGGQAKNADFGPLARSARRFARRVVLFGEDREQIGEYFSRTDSIITVTTLDEAIRLAAEWAQPGDVVLFSPACASFDMFDNFEHRGDTFRELVSGINQ